MAAQGFVSRPFQAAQTSREIFFDNAHRKSTLSICFEFADDEKG
jgi:hypothetical protein